jgi:hypothetical protein
MKKSHKGHNDLVRFENTPELSNHPITIEESIGMDVIEVKFSFNAEWHKIPTIIYP